MLQRIGRIVPRTRAEGSPPAPEGAGGGSCPWRWPPARTIAARVPRALRKTIVLFALMVTSTLAVADPIGESLRARLEAVVPGAALRVAGAPLAATGLISRFYAQRGFVPVWRDAVRREALLAALAASASHGLDPVDYRLQELRVAHERAPDADASPAAPSSRSAAATQAAELELLFTDAVIRYGYHLRFGKAEPRELDPDFNFDRSLRGLDPLQLLGELLAAGDIALALERLGPRIDAYRNLRHALARLRAVERAGGWPTLEPGPKLELGSRGERVATLRRRLSIEGDLGAAREAAGSDANAASSDDPSLFDAELDRAVRRFQDRHGLEADGVVGPRTTQALRATVRERIDQLRVNLDRIRWVATELRGDYLLVDIAGFRAGLWLDGVRAWESRVVVGRTYRSTPVFRATMQYLVLNPDWTVPPTILRRDVLPKVIADRDYLRQHSMQVLTWDGRPVDPARIAWERYRNGGFPYQIVQAPGPKNPLGRIKFMFPNPHIVYLHDTPSRELFERAQRAFSSGCIRVDAPVELARLLLDDAERWATSSIETALAQGVTRSVPVRRRVPVLVLYFTASADGAGTPAFRPDLYQRDERVLAALGEPFRFGDIDRPRRRP